MVVTIILIGKYIRVVILVSGFAISKISSNTDYIDPVFLIHGNVTSNKIGTVDLNCGLRIQGYRTNPYSRKWYNI